MTEKCLPARAVTKALLLVGAVRDDCSEGVSNILTHMGTSDLYALAVTLAAMVPIDETPSDLLAWNDQARYVAPPAAPRNLAPHGTHAAFNRHRSNGTASCTACIDAERHYQRNRQRDRRKLTLVEATG